MEVWQQEQAVTWSYFHSCSESRKAEQENEWGYTILRPCLQCYSVSIKAQHPKDSTASPKALPSCSKTWTSGEHLSFIQPQGGNRWAMSAKHCDYTQQGLSTETFIRGGKSPPKQCCYLNGKKNFGCKR